MFGKIAANTFWQILARIVSSGVSFVITIIIARSLGVNGYGDLAKITAFVSLFYLAVDLGLNAVFLQFEDHEERFRDLLSFRLALATILFGLVSIGAFLLPYNGATGIGYSPLVKIGIVIFGLTFISRAVVFSTTVLFQKKYIYRLAAFATALGSLATLVGIVAFLFLNLPFLYVVLAYVIGNAVEGYSSLLFAKERFYPLSFDAKFLKALTMQTFPVALMLFLNLIYFRVDMLLLSLVQPTRDVAVYDLAYKFFDFLIALPLFLSNSLYPALLASEKNTRISLQKLIVYTLGFFFLGSMVVIPVWFATPLISLIKPEFFPSSFALRLLLLSLPVFFATNILQWIFIAKKKQVFLTIIYACSLLINIFLNIIFIPQFSYIASAIITGVSEAGILMALLVYSFSKEL